MWESVGAWIKHLRGKSLTQAAFAEKLGATGPTVDPETVYRWENTVSVPPDWRLLQIMDAFAVPDGPGRDYLFSLARQDRIGKHGKKMREASETVGDSVVSDPPVVSNG